MKLPENSLFSILLRARWWVSFGAAAVAFFLLRLLVPTPYAAFAALPFLGIGFYVLSKELRRPSAKKVATALVKAREMPAEEFAQALEAAFRREGYTVKPAGGAADFELSFQGRATLVAFRRWKATRTGIEPLRELQQAQGDGSRMYVAAGEITDTARRYAAENKIRLVEPEELARLLAG